MIFLLALFAFVLCQTVDDEHEFQGDYEEDVLDIDDILEDMENEFIDAANQAKDKVESAFATKEEMYNEVVEKEDLYLSALNNRMNSEYNYNSMREIEEGAHRELLEAISSYDSSIINYADAYSQQIETIDFLNYELFIIHQIRELLGERIGYVPEQTIIDPIEYDSTYDGWTTQFPTILSSTYDHMSQRFPVRRRRKRRRSSRRSTRYSY